MLDPKIDVVFKMLFAAERNREILTSFLTAVLRPSSPIVVVHVTNPTIPGSDELKRQVIFDVHVLLADGKHIDVEMQSLRRGGPRERWLYNWGAVFTDQLDSGDEFARLRPVVSIVIMDFVEFEGLRFHNTFRVLEVHTHEEFSEHLELHTLELPKLKTIPPAADDEAVLGWGRFFAAESDEELEQLAMSNPDMSPAVEALGALSQDQEARDLARRRRVAELEYRSGLQEARAEGEAKALQEAIRHLCQMFGIDIDPAREKHLSQSTVPELIELHGAIAGDRAWPKSESPDKP